MEPKNEKIIFFGYSKDVKVYRIFQPNSIKLIIKRDVKFDKNISSCEPDMVYVPSSSSWLDSIPSLITSSDDDSKDENPPPLSLVPLPAPQFP